MPWTAPKTWAVNDILTAADMNTHVRDNLLALKSPPHAEVYTATGFTTTSTSFVDIDASLNQTIVSAGGQLLFTGMVNATGTGVTVQWMFDGSAFPVMAEGKFSTRWWAPAAGSHVVKPQWKVTSGTGTLLICFFAVRET